MFRKSTISDKYGWWMGQNFCHPAGNFRHLLRTGEKWCNDLLLGGEAPSKLRLRWRGSREDNRREAYQYVLQVLQDIAAKRWIQLPLHGDSSRQLNNRGSSPDILIFHIIIRNIKKGVPGAFLVLSVLWVSSYSQDLL